MKKRILITEKDSIHMNITCDVLMDLLDTSIEKIRRTREEAVIETATYKIIVKHVNEKTNAFHSQLRGHKADLLINNSMNQSIEDLKSSIMNHSKFIR